MTTISASAGMGGTDRRRDAITIQRLLARVGTSLGSIEGWCGRRTIGAIGRFQHGAMTRASFFPIVLAALLATGCSLAAAPPPPTPRCPITVPAEMKGPQSRWLGACAGDGATGVGVLRVGARAPFAFFFGRAVAGRPQTGLVVLETGNIMQIRGLDRADATVSADGEHPAEQDRAWADAGAGARLVARRFAIAGNAGSSAFYTRWAHRIETERPE